MVDPPVGAWTRPDVTSAQHWVEAIERGALRHYSIGT